MNGKRAASAGATTGDSCTANRSNPPFGAGSESTSGAAAASGPIRGRLGEADLHRSAVEAERPIVRRLDVDRPTGARRLPREWMPEGRRTATGRCRCVRGARRQRCRQNYDSERKYGDDDPTCLVPGR